MAKAEKVVVQLRLKDWVSRHRRVRSLWNNSLYDQIVELMGPDELLWGKNGEGKCMEQRLPIALPCPKWRLWIHEERHPTKMFVCGYETPKKQATLHRYCRILRRYPRSVVIALPDEGEPFEY